MLPVTLLFWVEKTRTQLGLVSQRFLCKYNLLKFKSPLDACV